MVKQWCRREHLTRVFPTSNKMLEEATMMTSATLDYFVWSPSSLLESCILESFPSFEFLSVSCVLLSRCRRKNLKWKSFPVLCSPRRSFPCDFLSLNRLSSRKRRLASTTRTQNGFSSPKSFPNTSVSCPSRPLTLILELESDFSSGSSRRSCSSPCFLPHLYSSKFFPSSPSSSALVLFFLENRELFGE